MASRGLASGYAGSPPESRRLLMSMSWEHRLEARLPGRTTLAVCLAFGPAGPPPFEELVQVAEERGYRVLQHSLRITFADSKPVWRFYVLALGRARAAKPALLAQEMAAADGVDSFSIIPVRVREAALGAGSP